MRGYDRAFEPPAPVVDVTVLHPTVAGRRVAVRGKLDTGADVTAIPEHIVAELRLLPHGDTWIRGFDGAHFRRPVYYVRLLVEGTDLSSVRCIAAARRDVLLGRNVLNRFVASLDGKNMTFEMRDP